MRLLAIAFVYNEIDYLPTAVKYYQEQGCEIYVIDNCSDDGTWEWLQEQGIPSHQFDTKDSFRLEWLQQEMIRTLHKLKPDWFIRFDADLFHVFSRSIFETVDIVSKTIHTQIHSICYSFKNTGEKRKPGPLFNHYRYAYVNRNVVFCSKYHPEMRMEGDCIKIPEAFALPIGAIYEYGGCKPNHLREVKLRRRQKAWELGEHPSHGSHYRVESQTDWITPKEGLVDVWRIVDEAEALAKLNNFFNG